MLCPSENIFDNNNPFAYTGTECRYHKLESNSPANTPNASLRIRKPDHNKGLPSKYLRYSVLDPNGQFASKSALNMNTSLFGDISIFPHDIYKKEPFASNSPFLNPVRDKTYLYTFSPIPGERERFVHTNTSSRFGYDRFPNLEFGMGEYGAGEQVFGYVEPKQCHSFGSDSPSCMAPPRFYNYLNLEENSPTEYRKIIHRLPLTDPYVK